MPHINNFSEKDNSVHLFRKVQQYIFWPLYSLNLFTILTQFIRNIPKLQSSFKPYRYKPLTSSMHIRYLMLWPSANPKDPLICTLRSEPIDDVPPFDAISYVWGNPEKVAQITCDNDSIHITANLDAVLRRLRSPDAERVLWADSICINQEDRKEQGAQVAIMGKIYLKASKTIIYLGPDTGGHAENVASLFTDITRKVKIENGDVVDPDSVPELDPQDPLRQDERWQSYKALLECPWFSRVWTVQEAAIGGDPRILWGTTEISWLDLIGVHQWLLTKAKEVWYYNRLWLNDIYGRGFWFSLWPMPNFVEVLARAKTLRCADERDRIYAFLASQKAKLGENGAMIVSPNYEKDFREVYLGFAQAWLENTQNLCLLSAIEHTAETFNEASPSWVPRWDVLVTGNYFGLYDQGFNASKGLENIAPTITSHTRLNLKGIICDTVIWRSDILPYDMGVEEPTISIFRSVWNYVSGMSSNELVTAWKHLSRTQTRFSYTDRSRLLAFTRTICRQAYRGAPSKLHPDEAAFALHLCQQSSISADTDIAALEKDAHGGNIKAFFTQAGIWAALRRFVLTENGNYALAPQISQNGDLCCVISGMSVPVILRKTKDNGCYRFVGEAFILGMMDGEAFENRKDSSEIQDITLC